MGTWKPRHSELLEVRVSQHFETDFRHDSLSSLVYFTVQETVVMSVAWPTDDRRYSCWYTRRVKLPSGEPVLMVLESEDHQHMCSQLHGMCLFREKVCESPAGAVRHPQLGKLAAEHG